jgi:hypothetical protein
MIRMLIVRYCFDARLEQRLPAPENPGHADRAGAAMGTIQLLMVNRKMTWHNRRVA